MDPQALDLATKTLAAAIDSLTTSGLPFVPLVMVHKGGERQVHRMVAERGGDAASMAKQLASSQTDAEGAAFAVDSAIPYEGRRFEAIVVESWNFVANKGARIGLRYELKGMVRKKPSFIGSPLYLGRGGWYDPEAGEPAPIPSFPEVTVVPPLAPALAQPEPSLPAHKFGPPPEAGTLAPSELAPPPPSLDVPELPRAFTGAVATPPTPAPTPPVSPPDFGPPPTTPAVAFDPPPGYGSPPSLDFPPPLPSPVEPSPMVPSAQWQPVQAVPPVRSSGPIDFPPPTVLSPDAATEVPATAAHPVAPPVAPQPEPTYVPVPIQRNETPLGNRAMFAGIMELATKNRSFPAFAIVQKGGEWEQVTMTDSNLADTPASVRAYARTRTDAEFVAFAVDAFVGVGGVDVTAVVVEVWEYSTRVSFSVAQRYVPTGDPPSPRLSGRPLMRTAAGWVDVPSSMMLGGQVQFAYSDPGAA